MKFRLLIISLLFLLGCAHKESPSSPLLQYVPPHSALIIKINDKSTFTSELADNHLINSFSATPAYTAILEKTKALQYLNTNSESLLSFVETAENKFEFLFIAPVQDDQFLLEEGMERKVEQGSYSGKTWEKHTLDGVIFYSTILQDKLMVASTQKLIEDCIDKERAPMVDPALNKLYGISNEQSSATIFINAAQAKPALDSLLRGDISQFTDWMSLDLLASQDHLKLNGISIVNDTLPKFLDLFNNTHALNNRTPYLAPENADAILSYTFNTYPAFAENQKKYLNNPVPVDTIFNAVEEIGIVFGNQERAIILHTHGSANILDFLDGIKGASEEYQGHEIVSLTENDFLNHYFNPLVTDYSANHYTVVENAFVFAPASDILKNFIAHYKNSTTFDKTATFITAKEQLADEASVLFVSNATGTEYFLNQYIDPESRKDIQTSDWTQYTFAAQLVAEAGFHHLNILVQKMAFETNLDKTTPLFSFPLEAEIATAPQFVKNHTTQKDEIILQDQHNILYLISTEGKLIWKKQLKGRVQGRIEQVDIHRNGRLQLAFTTDNQFLILDRTGKEVAPFTFSYEGGNLNPLAVFDYEKKRDYRFVVTQGSKLFLYDRSGKIVKGFKYTQAEAPINGNPKHFRIGKNDYIVLKLENGALKILSRTGEVRIPIKEKITFSDNPIMLHKNKFTLTDTQGRLYQIDEKGKVNTAQMNLLPDHGLDATTNNLVIMNDNELTIRSKKVELELGVYSKPRIFYLNDKIYVSVTDLQNQKVYLFDSQAEPISNFPIPGQSAIDLSDMDNDHKLELVLKDRDNTLIVYRIN